jgi:RNA polymerase sigma factor (sigma-70 family)
VADRQSLSTFDRVASNLLRDDLNRLLAPLTEREKTVLRLRYGLDLGEARTFEQVGNLLNLTRERIRQIEITAIGKLRHLRTDDEARDLLTG